MKTNKCIPHITGKERKLLKKIYKKGKGRISYRAQIILLVTDFVMRYTKAQIAAQCFCCRSTVYNIIDRFNEYGILGLVDQQKTGKPCLIQANISQELLEILEKKKPYEVDKRFIHSNWTLKLIKTFIERLSIKASQRTVSRWLHRNGWSYHRSKRELIPPKPLDEKEQKEVIRLLEEIDQEKEVIIFLDQSAFYLSGLPGGAWMPEGTQKEIYVGGGKEKFWIFGVFNPHTKKVHYRISSDCNSEQMVLFLRQLRQRYPGKTIHLVLDNASFHTSAETDYYLDRNPEFILHFIPPRGAKLNCIERFWLFAKEVIVKNAIFYSLDELYHSIRRFFWHYNEKKIEYNFHIHKLIKIWKTWPSVSMP